MNAALRIAFAGAASASAMLAATPAHASAESTNACARHAPEAARRSGLPADVILRVMHAESRGRPRAISHKGAMGCMQIMPGTWTYLTRRHGLGGDPFDPRMNMIGGALYLAEMARQFGLPGAYSAYNAGPGRYRRHIVQGVPLPAETVAYTAQISGNAPRATPTQTGPRWQEASLFIVRGDNRTAPGAEPAPSVPHEAEPSSPSPAPSLFPLAGQRDRAPPAEDDRP